MDTTDESAKLSIRRAWSGTALIADFHDGGWFQLTTPKLTITVILDGHTSGLTFYAEGPPFHVNGAWPKLPVARDRDGTNQVRRGEARVRVTPI